ncbi:MAG: acyl-CoA thioesterase [Actinomycetes bacterium]
MSHHVDVARAPAERRHVYGCPLRWSDMDAFGHVNNVVFLTYLEEARVDMLFALDSPVRDLSEGVVVARHEIDYKRPLVYRPEPVRIETWVTRVGAASFDVAYEVRDDDDVYVRAASVLVPYAMDKARPRRITPIERDFLSRFSVAGPDA